MNWFYAQNGQQMGPVDSAALDQLLEQRIIGPDTLVWCDGMTEWRPLSEARPARGGPPLGGILCSGCRQAFSADQLVKVGIGFVCSSCKPVALQKLQEGIAADGTSEQTRRDHIKHEASIKSVGTLYILGGSLMLLGSGMGLAMPLIGGSQQPLQNQPPMWAMLIPFLIALVASIVMLVTAFGLRKTKPWARVVAGIMSGLGLLGFPFGTLINGYILWLLFSKKGATVFSPDYQRVIAETPHIKYKTPLLLVILLIVVLVVIGLGFGAALFTK